MIELFFGGFIQMMIVAVNIRNITERNSWGILTTFLLAITWALIIRGIVRDLEGVGHILAYAVGTALGTAVMKYVDMESVQKITRFIRRREKGGSDEPR